MPRVARPSEATTFSRSAYITDTDIIFFMLCAIATVVNSALVNILPPQQGDRPGRRGRLSAQEQMKGVLPGACAGSPLASISCVSFWCPRRVSFWGPISSIFVKFTWHANPHYKYL